MQHLKVDLENKLENFIRKTLTQPNPTQLINDQFN
jgi:hypothetical protein